MLNEVLIALISVLGGAILGYYFDFFKQKREENIKLYETYISFTQETQYMILNFQSRMLIRQIDNFCGGDCIFKWNKYIKKKTVYDLEKINRFNRPL